MKKIGVILSALLLVLVGCGSGPASSDISGEIRVVTSYPDAEERFADVEAGFIAKYPDVTDVTFESTAGDYDEYITTRMSSGDYGDVLLVPFSLTRNLEQLPEFMASLGDSNKLSKDWTFTDQAAYEGQTYAMPISVNSLGMMYNTQVFADAGVEVPTSSEEMYSACEAIEAQGKTCWYSNLNTLPMLWSGGVSSYGGEGYIDEILAAGTAFEEGQPYRLILDFINEMITRGYTEADPMTGDLMTSMQKLASGDVGFIIMGSQSLSDVQAMAGDSELIKMAPFPTTYDGKQHMPLGPDELVGVSKNSSNLETSKAFLEYLISSESGYAYSNGGFAPEVDGNKEAPENLAYQIKDFDTYRTIATTDAESLAKFNQISNDANMASISEPIGELIEVATNDGDYEQLIADLEARFEQAVSENEEE